jgi:hypothetical protein
MDPCGRLPVGAIKDEQRDREMTLCDRFPNGGRVGSVAFTDRSRADLDD